MSQIRFATARSLFETFPELETKISVGPGDELPIAFLKNLSAQEKFEDAVAFCAHLLPRREAVWWGCGSARAFLGDAVPRHSAALAAAEKWVSTPNDEHRRVALEVGNQGDTSDPLTWLALAAGWSGGMLNAHPKTPVAMPQYMTARAVRIAVLLSARVVKSPGRSAQGHACVADGINIAESGL